MHLGLRIIHGSLRTSQGTSARSFLVPVTKFVIGTAIDCHMRCAGHSISPYHCAILVEKDRIIVEDRGSSGGTYVNDVRVKGTACLFHGDRLRVGKLEFEVDLHPPATGDKPQPVVESPAVSNRETVAEAIPTDTVVDQMVDMLVSADEEERERRRFDPEARRYHTPHSAPEADAAEEKSVQKKNLPAKGPPGKLPPPPPIRGQDTVDAAHQALAHLIDPRQKKKSP